MSDKAKWLQSSTKAPAVYICPVCGFVQWAGAIGGKKEPIPSACPNCETELDHEKRYGTWILSIDPDGERSFECTECGQMADEVYMECPHCNALMDY